VVHPVDRVLVPSTSLGSTLLDEHHEDFRFITKPSDGRD